MLALCVCVCRSCKNLRSLDQVPAGDSKKDLLDQLDQVPTHVQTLQFTVKEPTVGKAATFVKVDHVIRETKNLMNVINKVVTTCFECASKVSTSGMRSGQPDWSGVSANFAECVRQRVSMCVEAVVWVGQSIIAMTNSFPHT